MADPDETQKTESNAVYDRVHRMTFGRRTAGFMAGATLFGAIGAIGGLVASFLPYALGALGVAGAAAVALPGLAAIGSTVALFAGASAFLGLLIGADVGASAGSVTAGVMEYKNSDRPSQGASKGAGQKKEKLFSPMAAVSFGAIFAGFGALIALNPLTASAVTMMGFAAGTAAASVASGTMMGLLGISLGINFPMMSSKLSNFYTELCKGKSPITAARTELLQSPSCAQEQTSVAEPAIAQTQTEAPEQKKKFATRKMQFSLQGMIEKTEEHSPDDAVIRR